ncbi:MAG: Light-sensor Protein kinase [Chrysothrix sp. TS-e1954]|nr:MAG: Light-sensor Protein kinase [Chrysothrix sp. TS-e1954]
MAESEEHSPSHLRSRSLSATTPTPATVDNHNVPSIFRTNQSPTSSAQRPSFSNAQTHPNTSESIAPFSSVAGFSPKPSRSRRSTESSTGLESIASDARLSPDVADRVFPIRSFVSHDPNSTPQQAQQGFDRESYFSIPNKQTSSRVPSGAAANIGTPGSARDYFSELPTPGGTRRKASGSGPGGEHSVRETRQGYQVTSDAASQKSDSGSLASQKNQNQNQNRVSFNASATSDGGHGSVKDDGNDAGLVTARFKHVITEGGHAVITGRDGDTLQRCEDEPIHIPGAVQSFGLLIALREESEGRFVVRVVSENSKRVIGYTPAQLFALESFTDILSEEQADNLMDHVDFIKDEDMEVESAGPEVFTMSIRSPQRKSQKLWTAIHINKNQPDLVICEFELEDDHEYPLVPPNDMTPEPPESTLSSEPTDDELRESTEVQSRPLRILRSARKRKGEAAALEVFNIMSQVQEQLANAPNLDKFLKVLVGVVKELTGFHRVMIYQFDQTWNGRVVTELVDTRATSDLYKGLHFPASDIPRQARDLYRLNKVRLLYDRDLETARLVCRSIEDMENPLDLTHSYLRAMSPIHIKYLANMAVRSSMSISINAFDELWGLISCHTYGSKGTRVSFPIRKMCRLVGDSASRNIERLSYASRLQARKLINTAPSKKNPSGYIVASSDDLLKLFDADFGLLSIHGETKILGKLEGTQEALAMLEYCRMRTYTSVMTTQDIETDFPDLRYEPGFRVIAGLLLVPLTTDGADFIVFFRKGQLKEVKWAGNPYEKFVKEGTEGYLEPRKSFKTWSEQVVGKCREWTEEEMETAAVLCLVYGKFIEVWRQKEAALQNSQLTKLLLANSAHEVRTPLNAIINYLEIALEGSLDQETRDNLARSHSASKSLIYVINDLLDLTKTEAGSELVRDEAFDLKQTFHEAAEQYRGDAKRKSISYDVVEQPGLPDAVLGDQRRVRQAISNVVANAFQATSQGMVNVSIALLSQEQGHVDVEVAVEDTGAGMNAETLDNLFTELEQVQTEQDASVEDQLLPDQKTLTGEKEAKRTLGLGLAVVARIIRNMGGQMRLKSEQGKGSRFAMQFPFELPQEGAQRRIEGSTPGPEHEPSQEAEHIRTKSGNLMPMLDLSTGNEVTLVSKSPSKPKEPSSHQQTSPFNSESPKLSRRPSANSMTSLASNRSFASVASGKSEVDRLINALGDSTMAESQEPATKQRSMSVKGSDPHTAHSNSRTNSRHTARPQSIIRTHSSRRQSSGDAPGEHGMVDTGRPIKAVRVLETGSPGAQSPQASRSTSLLECERIKMPLEQPPESVDLSASKMRVLVAEDDPINSKIVQKRLQKAGHETHLTVNGEECSSAYGENSQAYDVILMDMQMPIVDGLTSTKMIRSFEKANRSAVLSPRASVNGRVPVIAVSATLVEKDREKYIEAGFDGWILKPINFARLSDLMTAIVDEKVRSSVMYKPGSWELGGWFHSKDRDALAAATSPTDRKPFTDTDQLIRAKELEQERAT